MGALFSWVAGNSWALKAARWGALALTFLLFLLSLRRAGEKAGRMAERLKTLEDSHDAQRKMLDAASLRSGYPTQA